MPPTTRRANRPLPARIGSQARVISLRDKDHYLMALREIREALIDAMLEHSRGLELAQSDWLVLAVRRNVERPQLAAADTDATTMMIRLKGSDLSAFLGGQISRAEARQRMDVRVF